jgi:hypothetical protein
MKLPINPFIFASLLLGCLFTSQGYAQVESESSVTTESDASGAATTELDAEGSEATNPEAGNLDVTLVESPPAPRQVLRSPRPRRQYSAESFVSPFSQLY